MENCEETSPGPSENYTGEDVDVSHDVDGKRMQLLKQSLDLSLEKFYSSIKYDFKQDSFIIFIRHNNRHRVK